MSITLSNKLLILDLDETLVHATKEKLLHLDEDFVHEQYYVYKRPHLTWFLEQAAEHFSVGIWSSAGDDYVNSIVQMIKPPSVEFKIVWGRSKCTLKRNKTFDYYYFEKRLDKLKKQGISLSHILIVDDTVEKAASNYGNAIYINEYKGNTDDAELPILLNYLLTLKEVENVRDIEKRNWRTR